MTIKYDRRKLAQKLIKEAKKRTGKKNKSFEEIYMQYIVEMLLEISQRVSALERVLAKKKVLHPKEINTEEQKVKKRLIKKLKKEFKLKI